MSSSVREIVVAEFEAADTYSALLDEYAVECAIDGMPPPRARMSIYHQLEADGLLHVFGSFTNDTLTGFIFVLVSVLPHYDVPVAVSESFFVAKASRGTGAGLKLLRAAEARAAEWGSPGLLVSAPSGGDLACVLPRVGYVESNRVFFKRVANGASLQRIAPMSEAAVAKVRTLEAAALKLPQADLQITHDIDGGMYSRTAYMPAGMMITGVQINVATLLIVSGDATVYLEGGPVRLTGYRVIRASAGRKQAFLAHADTYLTMVFPTDAKTVSEAEEYFTDEADLLTSRREGVR